MKKRYVTDNADNGKGSTPVSMFVYRLSDEYDIVSGGTSITSMSKKTPEFERYRNEHDVAFIFDDNIPIIDFYAIPQVDVFATDSIGGAFIMFEYAGFSSEAPIGYISQNKECFIIANNFKSFINLVDNCEWRSMLKPTNMITLYKSKADAEENGEAFLSPENGGTKDYVHRT